MILSFSWYQTSQDYAQYYLHFAQFNDNLNLNLYSSYTPFIALFVIYFESAEAFVLLLWIMNWVLVFYFLLYRNNFNNLFLLSYFILFSYLWHSNQLRQGIIMPIIIHIYYNRKRLTNKTIFFYSLILSCLLYTSPSPRDRTRSRMPSSA